MSRRLIAVILAATALTAPAWAAAPAAAPASTATQDVARDAAFQRSLGTFIDGLRATGYAPPGFVVVVSHEGRVVFEQAYGVRDASTGAEMTLDTPIYTASITKAYTGLMAAQLDARGLLNLDATLADVWPDLALQPPLDASTVTIGQLLSHSAPMVDSGLDFRANLAANFPAAEAPSHLSRWATPRPAGFRYGNFGPVLYSMMIESKSGHDWREVMARAVFEPMGLTRTYVRSSRLPAGESAVCNTRRQGGWTPVPDKVDAQMHAAGGLYASGRDADRFLAAFATEGASIDGRVPAAVLARTWAVQSPQDNLMYGMRRDGYGLGWDLSEAAGQRLVSRSGGNVGCRSIFGFSPSSGLAVTVLSVGDAAANDFNFGLFQQAFEYWDGAPEAQVHAAERLTAFAAAGQRAFTQADAPAAARDLTANALPVETLKTYVARYNDGGRLGDMSTRIHEGRLVADLGLLTLDLVPTGETDVFTGLMPGESDGEPFRFVRDAGGRVTEMRWGARIFAREN